jgi:hypothetical protein
MWIDSNQKPSINSLSPKSSKELLPVTIGASISTFISASKSKLSTPVYFNAFGFLFGFFPLGFIIW